MITTHWTLSPEELAAARAANKRFNHASRTVTQTVTVKRSGETAIVMVAKLRQGFMPIPYDQWEPWAKGVALLARNADVGVGDTVARLLGKAGKAYQAARKALGIPCHCPERRAEWNVVYAYQLAGG